MNTKDETENVLSWGDDAPSGGRTVMNRILKDKSTVPLFFAQTVIQSLRDLGYNHTTSALCEHVDNALQADATEIRVFIRQVKREDDKKVQTDVAIYDNGRGMSPAVLKASVAFGGSLSYGNRTRIGRFGMGMKTAALSMSPTMELFSWQSRGAVYSMVLDVVEVGKDKANLVELAEPTLVDLPAEVADLFSKTLPHTVDKGEQLLLSPDDRDLVDRLGDHGTIVSMPDCDRLTYGKAQVLIDHAAHEMARIYRRALAGGVKLYINNQTIEPFDPTYSMSEARHVLLLTGNVKTSRLLVDKEIKIRVNAVDPINVAPVRLRLFRLPIEEWSVLTRKVQRSDLRVFDGLTVSVLRNDRELFAGQLAKITPRHSIAHWWRLQVDFDGRLDEAFGVSANKQGVRLKGYVEDAIKEAIGADISKLNEEIRRFQSAQPVAAPVEEPVASERRTEGALLEGEPSDDENLRELAVSVKRDGETDADALERVRNSKYVLVVKRDESRPFYGVRHKLGRAILTINTAHPFFDRLYAPLKKISSQGNEPPIVALELLLLSLAKAQGKLAGDAQKEALLREWSDLYLSQLDV